MRPLYDQYWTKADQKRMLKRNPMTPMDKWLLQHLEKRLFGTGDGKAPPLLTWKSSAARQKILKQIQTAERLDAEKRRRLGKSVAAQEMAVARLPRHRLTPGTHAEGRDG